MTKRYTLKPGYEIAHYDSERGFHIERIGHTHTQWSVNVIPYEALELIEYEKLNPIQALRAFMDPSEEVYDGSGHLLDTRLPVSEIIRGNVYVKVLKAG